MLYPICCIVKIGNYGKIVSMKYVFNDVNSIIIKNSVRDASVDITTLEEAVNNSNDLISKIEEFGVDIFSILGMRNLSAFMGELFAKCFVAASKGSLFSNPHQDGYPDILVLDEIGKKEFDKLADRLKDKAPFSPFKTGGIEVKATCGAVPTPSILAKRGLEKPEIGDTRIDMLTGYDWKAHHRETNNLLGILWDFVEGRPTICAVFYSNVLTKEDWGNIVQPKAGGGRTTSVSIMTREGIKKMYEGWICVIDDDRYKHFLNSYNKSNLIK